MAHLIDKDTLVSEIERQQRKLCILSQSNEVELRKNAAIQNGAYCSLLSFLDTLEVKEVWHDVDEEPIYVDGVTPIIIDSNYGHISKEGHYYNQVQWKSHIEFQKHREFKWAYEKDLMNL